MPGPSPAAGQKTAKTIDEAPRAAGKPEKAVLESPSVVARKADKPVTPAVAVNQDAAPVKLAAQPAKKLPLASKAKPKPSPEVLAKKAAILAKRIATPVEPKAHIRPKPVKGIMLQPPQDRGLDPAFQDPPRQAIDRRCRAGELARECEARIR